MAHFNPAKIEEAIKGISFPAQKEDIMNCARGNNAGTEELSALQRLPEKEYTNPTDITQAMG